MTFYFKNTQKDILKDEKDEEHYRSKNDCKFCEKKYILIRLEIIVT